VAYGDRDDSIFLGRDMNRHRDYSESTAETIDKLVRGIIDEQADRARKILTDNREQLERLAKALLEHELLDREEIMIVIDGGTLESAKKTRSLPRNNTGQPGQPGEKVDVTIGGEAPSNL
jgi:cell division protease FtsH